MTKFSLPIFALLLYSCSRIATTQTRVYDEERGREVMDSIAHDKELPKIAKQNKLNQKALELEQKRIADSLAVDSIHKANLRPVMKTFDPTEMANIVTPEFQNKSAFKDIEIDLKELKDKSHYPAYARMTSDFGNRWGRMHTGIDIDASTGDNIYAAFDGVVRMAKYYSAYGNMVIIRHYNGIETVYAHTSRIFVKPNQEVSAGDVIALVGSTGRVTGDHLHFEVRVWGECVDPELILDTEKQAIQDKTFYATMRSGRIYASNSNLPSVRETGASGGKYHVVKSGDTLYRIAINNRTTVAALCKLNNISSSSKLRIGQRIILH